MKKIEKQKPLCIIGSLQKDILLSNPAIRNAVPPEVLPLPPGGPP